MDDMLEVSSPVGIGVWKLDDADEGAWTITGYPDSRYTLRHWDGAYEFEKFCKKHIDCEGIEFDSEYCTFFAYAETHSRAVRFIEDVHKHFLTVRQQLAS